MTKPLPFLPRKKPAEPTEGWIALKRLHAASPRSVGVIRPPAAVDSTWALRDVEEKVKLVRRVGIGGWSDVYKAKMGARVVALKVAASSGSCRLLEEWGVLQALNAAGVGPCPYVPVPVGCSKVVRGNVKFFASTPLGVPIDKALTGLTGVKREARLRRIGRCVLQALKHAHDRGYAHLDVRPSNLVWVKGTGAVLVDWGAAEKLGTTVSGLVGVITFAHDDIITSGDGSYVVQRRMDLVSLGYTLAALEKSDRGEARDWHDAAVKVLDKYAASRSAWVKKNASKWIRDYITKADAAVTSPAVYQSFA